MATIIHAHFQLVPRVPVNYKEMVSLFIGHCRECVPLTVEVYKVEKTCLYCRDLKGLKARKDSHMDFCTFTAGESFKCYMT